MLPKLFEHLRKQLGDEVQLLHDVHERVQLNEAINLCKALEPYNLFFLEDPFPPEDNAWFRILRQQTSVPIAMGELFNTVQEYLPLVSERLIDFIRIHISQIGGLSPARKVAALCEFFGVRTGWHGPGDASPVAHAAQLALELSTYNFGIHEGGAFPPETREVFRGSPEQKNGYMVANEAPGHGVDVDEKLAAKFPFPAGAAELRLLVGHDAPPRRHGDSSVARVSSVCRLLVIVVVTVVLAIVQGSPDRSRPWTLSRRYALPPRGARRVPRGRAAAQGAVRSVGDGAARAAASFAAAG